MYWLLPLLLGAPGPTTTTSAAHVLPAAKKGTKHRRRRAPLRPVVRRPGRPAPAVINFVNLHTDDVLALVAGRVPRGDLIDRFFQCRWTRRHRRMDRKVIGWIVDAAQHFGAREVQIISAYRHDKFNEMLRKKGRGVSRGSNHRRGTAIDFRLKGVAIAKLYRHLRRTLRPLRIGGVGRYPTSRFIHIDSGRYRTWTGK